MSSREWMGVRRAGDRKQNGAAVMPPTKNFDLNSGVFEGFHQFLNDFGAVTTLMGGGHVSFKVTAQHYFARAGQGALNGFDLPQHVHAVDRWVVEHRHDAVKVTAGDFEPPGRPLARVFRHAQVRVGKGRCVWSGSFSQLERRCGSLGHH